MNRALITVLLGLTDVAAVTAAPPPNIVLIVADDMGWGDLPVLRTSHHQDSAPRPHRTGRAALDHLLLRRALLHGRAGPGLLTGRLPVRSGMATRARTRPFPRLRPAASPPSEATIPEILKSARVRHRDDGQVAPRPPPATPAREPRLRSLLRHPLFQRHGRAPSGRPGEKRPDPDPEARLLQRPRVQRRKGRRAPGPPADPHPPLHRALHRLHPANPKRPFFLYLAHHAPHVPLFAHPDFAGKSARGAYGDVLAEMDDGVGRAARGSRTSWGSNATLS